MTASDGKLATNILLFARTLRSAGLPIGTSQVIDALLAVAKAGIERRQDIYWALRAILIKQPAHARLFNQAFHLYFRNPRLLEKMMSLLLPTVTDNRPADNSEQAIRRLMEAVAVAETQQRDAPELIADNSGSWSDTEILRQKDFEQMSLDELQAAKKILLQEIAPLRPRVTRRFRQDSRGERLDLRRMVRLMQKSGGDIIPLARKRRIERMPDLILICDISGSMTSYSRMFLQFAHTVTRRMPTVHTLVFGTRLTNVSKRLVNSDIDAAMQQIADDVHDWDGGTRIAESLRLFNRDWSRRILGRNAVVILLSDGLERDSDSDLEFQMARLRRSCRKLVWMNPMLRYDGFEAKATGVRKMLPHADMFVPAHNVVSLVSMLETLRSTAGRSATRQQQGNK